MIELLFKLLKIDAATLQPICVLIAFICPIIVMYSSIKNRKKINRPTFIAITLFCINSILVGVNLIERTHNLYSQDSIMNCVSILLLLGTIFLMIGVYITAKNNNAAMDHIKFGLKRIIFFLIISVISVLIYCR